LGGKLGNIVNHSFNIAIFFDKAMCLLLSNTINAITTTQNTNIDELVRDDISLTKHPDQGFREIFSELRHGHVPD
jgi:hypothetical protein